MAKGKSRHLESAAPSILQSLNAIRGEDQIYVECAVLDFHKVIPPEYLLQSSGLNLETKFLQGINKSLAVFPVLGNEDIHILSRIGKSKVFAADFPICICLTSCRSNTVMSASACLYSNAAIFQPPGHVLLAPILILAHGVKRAKGFVIKHGFVFHTSP